MAPYVYWFMAALGLMALEMATGTFYMLMLGIAMGVGGMAALMGFSVPLQISLTALAGVVGTVVLRRIKGFLSSEDANPGIDIGQPVQLVRWHADGTARVSYRGAEWDAEQDTPDMPHDGALYIKAIHGSKLVLTHQQPPQQ